MESQRLIDGASYGPDALKAMAEAFDEAWQSIQSDFGNVPDQLDIEAARLRLATALLSVASEDSRDFKVLKDAALQVMARNYRTLPFVMATTP